MPPLRVPTHQEPTAGQRQQLGWGAAVPRGCSGAGQPKLPIFTNPRPLRGRFDPGLPSDLTCIVPDERTPCAVELQKRLPGLRLASPLFKYFAYR